MMKIYKINAAAFGSYWEQDVNCPPGWRGSGCYDVEIECAQEATFEVVAKSLVNALKLVEDFFEKDQGDYSYNVQAVYYDTETVETRDDDWDGKTEEVIDWDFKKPEDHGRIENEYSCEICAFEFAWMDFLQMEPNAPTDPKTKKLAKRFFNLGRYSKEN